MASRSGATEHDRRRGLGDRVSYGVSEHSGTSSGGVRQNAWEGTLAFSNIGLAGAAVRGNQWSNKHRPRLVRLVNELFEANAGHGRHHKLLGILLNEVGNLSDLLDDECRNTFGDMMSEAFLSNAGIEPQIMWSPGETMAAFRPDIRVECLPQLAQMNRLHSCRTVDLFVVHGATEHGLCKLLVYNQHQPASTDRPFPATMRIVLCTTILRDAIAFCNNDPECCGFAFGGDANCSMAPWSTAFLEVSGWELTFQSPQFLQGVGRKNGDLMVAAAARGFDMVIYENRCAVEGREKQHDCILFKWSCQKFPHAWAPAWPSERQVRQRIQETNSSALANPARGTSEPASGAARGTSSASGVALEADQIEAEETPVENTLQADDTSSLSSVDWAD